MIERKEIQALREKNLAEKLIVPVVLYRSIYFHSLVL